MGVVERRHYISKMAEAVKGITPRQLPSLPVECRLSGLEPLNIGEKSLFVNVGERTNVTDPQNLSG